MSKFVGTLLVTVLGLALLGSGWGVEAADAVYKIGVIAPLTGPAAEAGIALRQGAQLAADEINAAGGVDVGGQKVKLELLFEDSTSKPEVGVALAEKLLGRDKVNFLVGEAFHSHVTMAIMELAHRYPDVPFFSWEPVSDAIGDKVAQNPERYANFWKGDFGSSAYARTVYGTVKHLVETGQFKPRSKTIAFVVEDTDYGRSNAADTRRLFEGDGWRMTSLETVPLGHTDFYPQLTKLRVQRPSVVVTVFTSLASGVAFVKQYQEVGLAALHMAIYFPLRPEFIAQAGVAAEDLLWTPLMFDPTNLPHQRDFFEAIQKRYNVVPTSDHAYGYDGVYIIANALERAGTTDGRKVNEAMATTDYRGLLGRYVFHPERHEVMDGPEYLPVPAVQIQNGRNVIVWPEQVKTADYVPQSWLE